MPDKDRWDVIYARCFKNQPEGHALYKKVLATKLKPGTCGYFDEQGDWQQIVDLTDRVELKKNGYSIVDGLSVSVDEGVERWPLRKSENMSRFTPTISGTVEDGLPVGGGMTIGYKKSSGNGAILVTDGEVTHVQASPPFKMCEWLEQNGRKVLLENPDARKKGLWIVTKTYNVKRRALALLSSRETEVTLSINAMADRVGRVEASTAWWNSGQEDAWNTHEDEQGVILSMDGIYWKDRWYSFGVRPVTRRRRQKFLSGAHETVLKDLTFTLQQSKDTELLTVELEVEVMGEVDGVRVFDPSKDEDEDEDEDENDGGDDDQDD